MQIAVVGTGYVGLVTGTCLAEVGHTVVCVDTDSKKIELLRDAQSPIFEPGIESLIKRNMTHDRLSFTTRLADALELDCQVVFIAVGTPEGEDGSADLRYVKAVAQQIGQLAQRSLVTIVKSTVPVGTCDIVEDTINSELRLRQQSFNIPVISNPEFLKEGAAIDDFMKPDRIVAGLKNGIGREILEDLYKPFITDDPGKLFVVDRRSSELTKYGSNAMLATRISFMNELSRLCEKVGANIDDVRRGMGSDPRIGKKFLYAGPGYGGSCFPKDVEALIKTGVQHDVEFLVLNAVSAANDKQKYHVTNMVTSFLESMSDKSIPRKVAVWGLAFKPGTDDVRDSPAQTIIAGLLGVGVQVVAHDPEAIETFKRKFGQNAGLNYETDAFHCLRGADALVMITEWPEYKRPDWGKVAQVMRTKAVFDLRNQYDAKALMSSGFYYKCVGRPDSVVSI